jgi:hypothetical protein
LLIENVRGTVVVPTAVAGKLSAATLDSRTMGGEPFPVMLTVAVVGTALLAVTVNVALSPPTTEGENVTCMLQLAPGVRGPVQLATSVGALNAKSPACAPLGPVIPLTANVGCAIVTCPAFVTWTVNASLELPTTTIPRFKTVGEIPRIGGNNPVPLSPTFAAATPWLVVDTVRVAVVAPAVTGEKITPTTQEAPAATLAPQVVVPTWKPKAPGPEIEKLGCPSGDPPLLVIVTVLAVLGMLSSWLGKLMVGEDKLISGGFSPVPFSFTDCARMASEITSVPVSLPATLGEKVTVTWHVESAAN